MNPEIHKSLLAADEIGPEFTDAPPGYSIDKEKSKLERLLDKFTFPEPLSYLSPGTVEDATFHSEFYVLGTWVRFSRFGGLVTIIEPENFSKELLTEFLAALAGNGYTYVPSEALSEDYDGPNPDFEGTKWGLRSFDYS